jgi:hypothetical protein
MKINIEINEFYKKKKEKNMYTCVQRGLRSNSSFSVRYSSYWAIAALTKNMSAKSVTRTR